jgi:hypothetical protein
LFDLSPLEASEDKKFEEIDVYVFCGLINCVFNEAMAEDAIQSAA